MIRRTMDATFLNTVANHPDVRPHIGGVGLGVLDLSSTLQDPSHIALESHGEGGWLLLNLLPGVYELHTLFLPQARGARYFKAAREALRYLFTHTDALEILTKCPDDNPGARMAATIIGFRERFHRADAWAPGVGISFQAFTLDDWMARDRMIQGAGEAFHDALETEKALRGSTLPTHPVDPAHDRAVGAAVLMVKAGQTAKAMGVYGRWATFAGYATIQAISQTVIDVGDAIVEFRDGTMGVLLVRGAPPQS